MCVTVQGKNNGKCGHVSADAAAGSMHSGLTG